MSDEANEAPEIDTPATQIDEQGEQPQPPESAPDTNEQPDTGEDDQEHRLPKGVQKRIDRLTREKYRLQAQLDVMQSQRQQPEPQRQPAPKAEGAPTPDKFSSYEEYLEAKAEWKAEQKVAEVLRKQQESTQQQSAQAEHAKLQRTWEKRVQDAMSVYDDFEEVALSPDVPVTQSMMQSIIRAEKGADVAYFLGKNPEVAQQIAQLDPVSVAIRIGEIAATVARPAPKKTTSAPPPISPVGSRSGAPQKDPDKMTVEEWTRWRNDQIKTRK